MQCGGKKVGRGRVLVQCEADEGHGRVENGTGESRSDNGSNQSSSIVSEAPRAADDPDAVQTSGLNSVAYALLIRLPSIFNLFILAYGSL